MELKIEHLSKHFKDKNAVDDVCLTLTPGVWGLLGAKGAGKTTLMRMIADIMTPTSGTISYDGTDIHIMDEPTAGLDPGERVRFRNFISEFSHNRMVLISTHIVSDIEYIATRNAIMKAGHIIDVGTTDELVKQIEGKVWNCTVPAEKLPEYELRLRIINQRGEDNNQVSIRYLADKAELDGAVPASPRLEDLYLWLFPQTDLEKEGM